MIRNSYDVTSRPEELLQARQSNLEASFKKLTVGKWPITASHLGYRNYIFMY
jgi:hypothetical protein